MLIATNLFARLYKENDYLYIVTIEDLFKAYICADTEEQALQRFFAKDY